MCWPTRTARENPTLPSYGDPDDARLRVVSMTSSCRITGRRGSPRCETEPTARPAAARHTLGPCTERALSGRHDGRAHRARRPHPRSPRDRSRHRRHRPHPHRPRVQGVAEGPAPGRPVGAGGARPAREAAGARPRDHRRPLLGLRRPQRRPRFQPGARRRGARRHGPPAGRHREPVLRQLDPDHADGLPRHQGRRGRRLPRRRRRVRLAVHQLRRGRGQRRRGAEPAVRGCRRAQCRDRPHQRWRGPTRARTACCPTSTSRWGRPQRTWRPRAASPASARTSGASAARTAPRRPSPTGSSPARSCR